MESVNLDMDDIFDRDGDGDDIDNFPSALPDLPEELAPLGGDDDDDDGPGLSQDAENAEVLAKLKGMKGAGKRVIRNPQPKLDGTRLTGDRGIPILPYVFKDVKFKGKGHEAEDLRVIMKHMEHWAHRLFPRMPFDEVLERVEKLGNKKEVQTCIKKMRLDIPVIDKDFARDEEEVKDDDDDDTTIRGNQVDLDAEAAFDEIVREEQEQRLQSQRPSLTSLLDTPSRPAPSTPAATPSSQAATPSSQVPVVKGLTPAQRDRMETNKRLAMERKAAKLAQQNQGQSATPPEPSTSATDQTKGVAGPGNGASTEETDIVDSERSSPAADSLHLHLSVQSDTLEKEHKSLDQASLQLPPAEESDPNSNTKTPEDSLHLHLSVQSDTPEKKNMSSNKASLSPVEETVSISNTKITEDSLNLHLSVQSDTPEEKNTSSDQASLPPVEESDSTSNTKTTEDSLNLHLSDKTESDKSTLDQVTLPSSDQTENTTNDHESSSESQLSDSSVHDSVPLKLHLSVDSDSEKPASGDDKSSMCAPMEHDDSTGTVACNRYSEPSTGVSEISMEQPSESLQLCQDVSQDSSSHSENEVDDMETN